MVTRRRLAPRYFLLTLLVLLPTASGFGDGDHGAPDKEHQVGTDELTGNRPILDYLLEKYPAMTKETLLRKFNDSLLPAVRDAAKPEKEEDKKEDKVATMIAELMGGMNDNLAQTLIDDLDRNDPPYSTECGDQSKMRLFDALKVRLRAAARFVLKGEKQGTSPEPKCNPIENRFLKTFAGAWEKVDNHNREYHRLLGAANDPSNPDREKAKEAIRQKYGDHFAFAQAQRQHGRKDLADSLVEALSSSENANRFLDVFDASGKPVRFTLGQNARGRADDLITRAPLSPEDESKGGLRSFRIAPKPHPGSPRVISVPEDNGGTRQPGPTGNRPPEIERAEAFMGKNCQQCHGPGSPNGELFDASGKIREDKANVILNAFTPDGQRAFTKVSMKVAIKNVLQNMTDEERADLIAWAKAHGRPGFEPGKNDTAPNPAKEGATPKSETKTLRDAITKALTPESRRKVDAIGTAVSNAIQALTPEAIKNLAPLQKATLDLLAKAHGLPNVFSDGDTGKTGEPVDEKTPPPDPGTVPLQDLLTQLTPPGSLREEAKKPDGLIKESDIIPAEEVRAAIEQGDPKLRIWSIGGQATIKGAKQIGAMGLVGMGEDAESNAAEDLAAAEELDRQIKTLSDPEHDEVILYCGCCYTDDCPNLQKALAQLKARGVKNVKILDLDPLIEKAKQANATLTREERRKHTVQWSDFYPVEP